MNVSYLPGVKIDYDFGDGNFYAIIILSPKTSIIDYTSELKRLVMEKANSIHLTKDDFVILHKGIEYIFIPIL